MMTLEKAIIIATKAHEGQVDKAGAPYILHPLRVMLAVKSIDQKMAAVLHDVVEDTSVTLAELKEEGFSEEVLEAVKVLTRDKEQTYDCYIEGVAKCPLAIEVKMADLQDNMDLKRLKGVTDKDMTRVAKYIRAHEWLKSMIAGT